WGEGKGTSELIEKTGSDSSTLNPGPSPAERARGDCGIGCKLARQRSQSMGYGVPGLNNKPRRLVAHRRKVVTIPQEVN
ncbi:MAG TPA: hypothetical protein PLS55_05870, partial [Thermogutta sp.]|nr:hypothetical protein [Thermogutta sp.]